jgi:hypothetical protein
MDIDISGISPNKRQTAQLIDPAFRIHRHNIRIGTQPPLR